MIQLEASIGLCLWLCNILQFLFALVKTQAVIAGGMPEVLPFELQCGWLFQWVSCIGLKDLANAMDSFEKDLVGDLSSTVINEICATAKTPARKHVRDGHWLSEIVRT